MANKAPGPTGGPTVAVSKNCPPAVCSPDTVRRTELMPYMEALPRRTAGKRLISQRGGVYALAGMTGTKRCESYSPPAWMMCSPLLTLFS